ncbi:efflux RND transporter periplasmic adaptor subunit [Paenibacillus sp. 481]|uniref:efflux RND transporter periplasmic adaptor subunit n=1 Tax=Paenibacillus sp. 481 TaxID=2835869 RepID=UPI001E3B8C87|nr:efflux RND transporter periplasmic adaptor subunit [Paenibacillus sp. 481]UHA74097.1 efflux RND transporter periplasmic adaptor subunit [Paenibacillus sp. 481]
MSTKWSTENSFPNDERKSRRAWHRYMAALMCSALLFTSACSLLPQEEEEEVLPTITAPAISKKPEHDVTTGEFTTKASSVSGKIMSEQEEALSFTLDGKKIKNVLVKTGDNVKAGQKIAELDMEQVAKDIRKEKLELRKTEAALKKELRDAEAIDPVQLEEKKVNYQLALDSIADKEKDMAKGVLTAPFDGTVVSVKSNKKGENSKSYETIAVVANTSRLVVAVEMDKDDLTKVSPGMETEVSINNFQQKFKGKVKALPTVSADSSPPSDRPDEAKHEKVENFMIVQLDKVPKGLTRGTPLSADVILNRKKNAVIIPPSALREVGGRTYVQVVDEKGKREVDIEVGLRDHTQIEVIKGLTPGQKVVGR